MGFLEEVLKIGAPALGSLAGPIGTAIGTVVSGLIGANESQQAARKSEDAFLQNRDAALNYVRSILDANNRDASAYMSSLRDLYNRSLLANYANIGMLNNLQRSIGNSIGGLQFTGASLPNYNNIKSMIDFSSAAARLADSATNRIGGKLAAIGALNSSVGADAMARSIGDILATLTPQQERARISLFGQMSNNALRQAEMANQFKIASANAAINAYLGLGRLSNNAFSNVTQSQLGWGNTFGNIFNSVLRNRLATGTMVMDPFRWTANYYSDASKAAADSGGLDFSFLTKLLPYLFSSGGGPQPGAPGDYNAPSPTMRA